MLDVFEFMEGKKSPLMPPGTADMTKMPSSSLDAEGIINQLKAMAVSPAPPPADTMKGFRALEAAAPVVTPAASVQPAAPIQPMQPTIAPARPVAPVPDIKDIISDFRAIGGTSALPARPAAVPASIAAPATLVPAADIAKDFKQQQEKAPVVEKGSIDIALKDDDARMQQRVEESGNRFIQSLGRGFEELGKGIVKGLTVYTPPKEGKERGIAGRIIDWAYTPREDATFADKANNIVGEMLGNLPFYLMGEGLITKAVKTFGPAATLGLSAQAIKSEAARQAIPAAETALGRILQSGVRSAGQLAPRLGTLSMARQVAQEAANPQEGMMQRVGISAGEGLVAGAVLGFTFGAIAQAYPEARFKIQVMRAGRKVALPKDVPHSFTNNEVQAEISRLIDEGWRYDPKRGMFTDPNNPTYAATIYVEHQGKSIRLTEILKQYGGKIPSETTLASSIRKTTSGTMRPAPIETKPPMPKATVPAAQTASEMGIRLSEDDVSKIVFQKLVGQGNTPQVAQGITRNITDTLHSAGLELNMDNISKHFGDILTISAEDIATAGRKGIAKAEAGKEGIAKTKETIYQKVVEQGVEPQQAEQVINEISNELSRQGKEFTIDNVLADYGEVLGIGMPKAETPVVRELPDLPEPPAQSMEEIKRSMQEHQREQKEGQVAEQTRLKAEQEAEAQRREEELRVRTEEMRKRVARLMEREGLTGEVPGEAEPLPGEIGGIPGKVEELHGKTEGVADKGVPPAPSPKEVGPKGVNKEVSDFSPPATGKTATAKTIEGTEIKTKYALVDANADDLIVSHDTDLRENPNYPQELQPRDRTRIASEVQINKIMQKMEPSWLGASPKASDGAPIVGKDGVVESGNGRIIALQKIYKTGHKNKELYKKWLNDNIEQFGISKKDLSSIKNPVLVRVRQSDVDRIKFVEEANKRSTAPMSDSEMANLDAKKITGKLMESFVPTDSGEILTAANREFVSAFLSGVIGQTEMGEYITDDGGVSQKGLTRIRNAIFARAFGENEAIKKLAEINDVNVRNQINAMLMVAPKLIKMKESIEKGSLHDFDISKEIAAAMNKLSALRSAGTSVQDYLRQMSLVEDDLNPLAKDVLMLFDKNKRSAKKIAAILQAYTEAASVTGDPRQRALVETKKPTKAEILEYAVREAEGLNEKQIDVFSSQRIGSAGDKKDSAGTQAESKPAAGEGGKTARKTGETQAFFGTRQKLGHGKGNVLTPVKRSEIVKLLSAKLNVPIRIGRFTQRAWGIFKVRPEVIRTRIANDIPTVAHEVGHYLDKELGLADKAFDAELMQLGSRTSRPSYSKKQVRAEGVAEFMRLYLTEPDILQKQAPGYYAAFEDRMLANGEIHDVLLQARADIKAWMEQPAKARILGSLSIGEKKPRKMSLERLYTATVDELRPIERYVKEVAGKKIDVERNPYIIAWLARGWTGKAETYLYHGAVDGNYNKIGPSLEEILKPLSKNLDDFRAYLVAKRAVELHGRAKRTGIDHDDAVDVIKELETPAFKEAQKKIIEYQDALIDELVEAGVISKQSTMIMRRLNQNYVPFYRVFGEQMGGTYGFGKGGYANIVSPVKTLKGSERDIIDPLESIIKNTFSMINVAERNRVGKTIVELAGGKEGAGKWVESVPAPVHGVKVSLEEIEDVLEAVGIDTNTIDLDTVAHIFRPTYFPPGKENILTVFRNGEKMFYQLEPELYRATLALDKEASNLFINLISLPAKTLRAGATLTPEFMARNPIRDIQEAMVFSSYGFNPTDFVKGLFHALKQDDIFWKWKASGGAHGAMVSLDRDYLQGSLKDLLAKGAKDKALNILKNPLEILQALSEFGEQATRIGEFAKGLEHEPQTKAGTMMAALSSRDVTLDFMRSGYAGKIPNRVIAFFNANVQGIDKNIRGFRRNPNRTLLRCLLYITLPTVLLYFNNRKDKRYQELPQWQKDVYWVIPTKKRLYRVPKPFTLGVIFGAFPERVLSYMETRNPKAFDEFGKSLRENALPDLIPTAFMGWVEAYSNKSFYTGRAIVPRGEETLAPEMQYSSYTSETAKLIGSVLEYPPRKIDHILKSYGGGLATHGTKIVDELIKLVDKKERVAKPTPTSADYPLVGAFAPRMWASSDSIDKFYQKLDEMEREYKTAKKKGYAGPAKKELTSYRSVARELSKLRVAAQDVHTHPTMTAKEKRDALDAFSVIQINMARKTLGMELITKEEAGIK